MNAAANSSASALVADPVVIDIPAAARERAAGLRLAVTGLTARFGPVTALDDVSVDVPAGAIVCLLGPSGSGKSTLLRLVAGLERPTAGRIVLDGVEVSGPGAWVEPEHRRTGMVFQDFALFPHLTIAANVGFGLRGQPRAGAARLVADLLERLDLSRHAGRYPHMLSGGERQRAALARALAPGPRVLLMDEPFSSLDDRLRDRVRDDTVRVLRETRTTAVIVTHDPREAMRVGDRIVLLQHGRVAQCGTPADLYARPATCFAARFFSDVNELPGVALGGCVDTPLGRFDARPFADGTPVTVCVRPQHLCLSDAVPAAAGTVVAAAFLGEADQLQVALPAVAAPLTVRVADGRHPAPGDRVMLHADPEHVMVFRADAGASQRAME